jgi:transposase
MIDLSNQIFVYTTFVDMRKSINGLCILTSLCHHSPYESGQAFVFFNKKCDKVKILVKENNGFVLVYKRLDRGRFKISFSSKSDVLLTQKQLRYLLDGLDYTRFGSCQTGIIKHYF